MPSADQNRLKCNFAESYVASRVSAGCLVRPVANGTDIGIDFYCETVEEGTPFLHFWVQVKSGDQCRTSKDGQHATCSFEARHLEYWGRQPVPVFAALVPTKWPVEEDPIIYVVDVTTRMLGWKRGMPVPKSLRSDYVWRPGHRNDVVRFLRDVVPVATARVRCKEGIVATAPTPTPSYENVAPAVPVTTYWREILQQIRRTAAFSINLLLALKVLDSETEELGQFRHTLASILEQFPNDPHWESLMARAISYHADEEYEKAVDFYTRAIYSIQDDPNVSGKAKWRAQVKEVEEFRSRAGQQLTIS
jgi:hypothetical protein